MSNIIKNIIFDFGGVILNIDFNKSIKAFSELGIDSFEKYYSHYIQSDFFADLETGNISPEVFYESVKKLANNKCSQEEICNAWNAMLLDLPKNRIDLLKKIKTKYRSFLLSNSNAIHYDKYLADLNKEHNIASFDNLFEKTFFSFRLGIKKPSMEIFSLVLSQNNILAKETLFIDDSIQNIEAAKNCGLHTYCLKPSEDVVNLFDKEGILLF